MKLLLDTHAVIWWMLGDIRLSERASHAIDDPANVVHVSAAVGWEVAPKVRLGKMPSMANQIATYEQDIVAAEFHHLPAEVRHFVQAGSLVGDHGDPFDRLIAAQALLEDMTVVTRDRAIAAFGCRTLW